ncbi:long-chain fatty acid--CoA ligase [Streptomyces sp. CAI-21]|uniref:class I adenylate-forming enzyme family protein n=1 Tax=Streptomyces TaxID=1883 RepID=UPI000526576F|nr:MULTISPECIES: AMP-binding protein [Streptomyces]MBO1287050.1 AMP-binding protein [Streptomyces sampsonii]NUW06647.1 long-chain fatty acid--CoA ligase [Streptomyces sp. CAI-21]NVI30428.1 long-chain fatty acid--CoA ligase [Streptomyces sp. CAI-17]WAC94652.1 AMP-binding protein [Streptomyces sp. NA13]WSD51398.1 AMP-binding protein [Streptomyces albidoflavus]
MWLTQLAERNRQCHPDRTALVDERRSVTWAQFHDRTVELARGLAALGIRRGDRVAVLAQDRIEVVESYFALARLGALFVPLNHSLAVPEVAGIIERVGAVAVLGESALLDRHTSLPASVRIRMPLDKPVFDALGTVDEPVELPEVADTDPVAILHTSATTGQAKGVTVDGGSFRAIALGWLVLARPTDDIVMVNCCPLYHGSMVVSLTYMAAGATIVLMPGFTPQRALAAVEENRATHMWMVPQMVRFMLQAKGSHRTDLGSLREILYGAAPMPLDVYAEAVERLGCGFRQVYGMTEVGGPFVTLGPDEHPEPGDVTARIPCGRVVPGMSARALGEDGQEVERGEIGEIVVRGPGVMQGYWNDPEATEEVTADGWVRTGDLGFVDEGGRIHLVDRSKDVIIRAGQNVYPSEIERALTAHPEVRDAAVVGVPDEDYGEVPLAYVVVEEGTTTATLLAHVRENLAPYKRPRSFEFIERVPRNPAGKILKKALRA